MKKINPLLLASTAFPLMGLLSSASAFGPEGQTPSLVIAQAAPSEAPGRVRPQDEEPGSKRDEKRVRRGQEQSGEASQGERRPDARAHEGKQGGKEAPRPHRGEAAKENSESGRPGREPAQPQRPAAPAGAAPSVQPTRPAQTLEKPPQQPSAPAPQRAQETPPTRSAEPPAPARRSPAGEATRPLQEQRPVAPAPGAAPRTAPQQPTAQEPATRQHPSASQRAPQEAPPARSAEPPAPARRAAPAGEATRPLQEQQPTAPAPGAAQRTAPAQPSAQETTQPPRQRPGAPRSIETAPATPPAPQPVQPTARPERQEPLRPQQPALAPQMQQPLPVPQTAPTPQIQQSAPVPQMAPAPLPGQPADIRRQPEFGGQAPADLREGRIDDLRSLRRQRVEEGGRRVIIEEPGDRTIIRENGRVIIRHDETARFRQSYRDSDIRVDRRGDSEVTVIRRPDGIEIVTVRDRDGNLIRRVRREPAGRETVLIDNRIRERPRGYFVDEVIDLPPPQVRIPRQKYVVEVERASQADLYEAFTAPPIERVQRAYTLDEIRQSHSLRERVRRVDLDTVTFEFGSWTLPSDQIGTMTGVAQAIERALANNPNEIFLIEGHTDAVGTDEDNLTLSDRRAETVATILTDRFRIPAENLTTQGYGEQYLKINTQEPERQNRRVTLRRITPLLKGAER